MSKQSGAICSRTRNEKVFDNRYLLYQLDVLEGTGNSLKNNIVNLVITQINRLTVLIFKVHIAAGCIVEAGDAVKHGGLACAVRTYKSEDLALLYVKGKIVNRLQTAEIHLKSLDRQKNVIGKIAYPAAVCTVLFNFERHLVQPLI